MRFEVLEADSVYDEKLRIQDFMTAEEAQAGFTDDAIFFRREHPNILLEETLKRIIVPIRQIFS